MPVLAHAKANVRATAGTGADAGFEMGIEDGRLPLIGLILSVGKMRVQSSLRLGRYVFPIIAGPDIRCSARRSPEIGSIATNIIHETCGLRGPAWIVRAIVEAGWVLTLRLRRGSLTAVTKWRFGMTLEPATTMA